MSDITSMQENIKGWKNMVTIGLAVLGIAVMVFYSLCDTSCSYLRGDIMGIDLKYIGIGYMLAVISLMLVNRLALVRILLALGIGAEVHLVGFQFQNDVFCPFCLAFGATIVLAFLLNYETPTPRSSWWDRLLRGLGEVELPLAGRKIIPLLPLVVIGYILILLMFSGSVTPAYGAERPLAPSYGEGPYELIVFTDYFCPPCQALEPELKPSLDEILSKRGVKVTFVDMPIHKLSLLYIKYFLYIVNAGNSYREILRARDVLFAMAKANAAGDDATLALKLEGQKIAFAPFDLKPVYGELNRIIQMYKVNSTPTCVVKYSDSDVRKYVSANEIRKGLSDLRLAASAKKR